MSETATGKLSVTGTRGLAELPGEAEIDARAGSENFSVASLLVPPRQRRHLLAIYGFARLVDQVGDAGPAGRLARLDEVEAQLRRPVRPHGAPTHPVITRLAATREALALPLDPFLALIEANRRDQIVSSYQTFDELLDYCALSANPVGELVLRIFGVATPERIAQSNAVCSALQLAEHWQDVAEDYAAGRVYLPAEDRARFGVSEAELGAPACSARLAALLEFEVGRARALLDSGAPLVGSLHGAARIAVAGYVGGGRATLDAILACGCDVLAGPPRAHRGRRLRESLRAYRGGA
jgi:squalene synthase HpnC